MSTVYDFEALQINGQPVSLSQFKGRVMLIVNTASACGFTPQFAGLEELHQTYDDQGLVVEKASHATSLVRKTPAATMKSPSFAS